MTYDELAFWEKAFLARASSLTNIRAGVSADDCASFADCAVIELRRAKTEPLETPPVASSEAKQ